MNKSNVSVGLDHDTNQSRSLQLDHDTNQTRREGMFLNKSNFEQIDRINPFVEMSSNPAVSDRQQRFMAMCAHDRGRARGKCPSKKVAEEFSHRG